MANKDKNDLLISDFGITEDAHTKQAKIFVLLCDIVTISFIILGIVAFIKGGNV